MKRFLFALCLAPLACGGGDNTGPTDSGEGEAEAEGDGDVTPAMGTVLVNVEPALASATPFQLVVDGVTMMSAPTGESAAVDVEAGRYDMKIVCPGYGYAVAGYEWCTDLRDSVCQPVSEWTMERVEVTANATVEITATVCRDLTGWQCDCSPTAFYLYTQDGQCKAQSDAIQLVVTGDTATVIPATWACDNVSAPISGGRIEFDCGVGEPGPDCTCTAP